MVVAHVATLNPPAKRVSRRDVRLNAVNAKNSSELFATTTTNRSQSLMQRVSAYRYAFISSNVYPLTAEGLTEAIDRLMFAN